MFFKWLSIWLLFVLNHQFWSILRYFSSHNFLFDSLSNLFWYFVYCAESWSSLNQSDFYSILRYQSKEKNPTNCSDANFRHLLCIYNKTIFETRRRRQYDKFIFKIIMSLFLWSKNSSSISISTSTHKKITTINWPQRTE